MVERPPPRSIDELEGEVLLSDGGDDGGPLSVGSPMSETNRFFSGS